ncbi:MAG: alpha/beta fold hydrolase [Acidobacteriota bacterium]|nr:alpha/beta fold hydrolase [Acidobacteriota bacterium]
MFLLLFFFSYADLTLENGLRLHYVKEGSGPPVVMITGLGARLQSWEPTSRLLKKSFTVIRLDNRGMGGSGDLQGPYSVDVMAEDAAGLMAGLGFDQYHVVGLSLGSFAAQSLALQHPDRVKKLVLLGSSAGGPGHVAPGTEVMTFWQTMATMAPLERARKGLALALHPDWVAANPEAFQKWAAFNAEGVAAPGAVQRQAFAGMAFNHSEKAAKIAVPTLILHGDRDLVVPTENGQKLHGLIPGSKLIILPDSGHMNVIDKPVETAAAITEFLKN